MTFDDLLGEVKKVRCVEARARTVDYCEVVVAVADLQALAGMLQSYFGAPFKPEGQRPSDEAIAYAAPYGGIYDRQTMYVQKNGRSLELALVWPWGSGKSATVKIIRKKETNP